MSISPVIRGEITVLYNDPSAIDLTIGNTRDLAHDLVADYFNADFDDIDDTERDEIEQDIAEFIEILRRQ